MLKFWVKTGIVYGIVALGFSLMGIAITETMCAECYDRSSSTIFNEELFLHILGHVSFGLILTLPMLSLRYIIAGGMFAIVLDADHLLHAILTFMQWNLGFEITISAVPRMGHSILFGVVVAVILLYLFRKDIRLGIIGFTAIFSHMSFDILTGGSGFPLFTPISNEVYRFPEESWIYFFAIGIMIVTMTSYLVRRKRQKICL